MMDFLKMLRDLQMKMRIVLYISVMSIVVSVGIGLIIMQGFIAMHDRIMQEVHTEITHRPQQIALEIDNAYQIHLSYRIKTMEAVVTGYAPSAGGINCSGDCNVTSIGFKVSALKSNSSVTYCAVDPKVIPYGSIIIIQGLDKPCVAVDTGGSIKGNHIDYLFHDEKQAYKWGKRTAQIIVLRKGD